MFPFMLLSLSPISWQNDVQTPHELPVESEKVWTARGWASPRYLYFWPTLPGTASICALVEDAVAAMTVKMASFVYWTMLEMGVFGGGGVDWCVCGCVWICARACEGRDDRDGGDGGGSENAF